MTQLNMATLRTGLSSALTEIRIGQCSLPAIRSKTESSLSLHFSLHHESWISLVYGQSMFSFKGIREGSLVAVRRPTAVRDASTPCARAAGERLDASESAATVACPAR